MVGALEREENIKMDLNKKIRKARYRFMEAKPFWSSILGIPYTCDETTKRNTQALSTDGKQFYLNPDYINSTEIDDLTLDFAHEFLHVLLGHTVDKRLKFTAGIQQKFYATNLAADYVVNNIVREEFGRILDDMYYDPTFAHMTFEQIFNELYREDNSQIQQRLDSGKQNKGNGEKGSNPSPSASGEKDVSKEIEDMFSEISEDDDEECNETEKAKGSGQSKGQDKEDQKENTTAEEGNQNKGEKKQAYFESHQHWRGDKKKGSPIEIMLQNVLMSAHLQGMLPAGLEREIEDILHPAIPIRDVISSFVLEKSSSKPNWKRMKKRFYPPIYFPKQDRRDKLHIGIGIDTSGSIEPELLSEFKSSMQYLFSFFKRNLEVVVFQADSKIQGVDIIRDPEDMDNITWRGGGGTDFRPVFDEMRDKYSELKGLVYITDSFGTFPNQEPNFPVVWLIPSKLKQYHNKIPFGKEIFYEGAMCKE